MSVRKCRELVFLKGREIMHLYEGELLLAKKKIGCLLYCITSIKDCSGKNSKCNSFSSSKEVSFGRFLNKYFLCNK